jgi:hypothetical protein
MIAESEKTAKYLSAVEEWASMKPADKIKRANRNWANIRRKRFERPGGK